ncbi:MAG: hypothetical protein AAF362_12390 [Pseudomonadota bacterium]
MLNLHNKCILTAGDVSGIGRAIARQAAAGLSHRDAADREA